MPTIRTTIAALATTALIGGGAAPAVAQTADYPSDTSSSQQQQSTPKKGKKKPPRRLSDAQLTRVAEALGTTLAALKAAQAEVKSETAATEAKETPAQKDALLASKLDVTAEQVRAAFRAVERASSSADRPARGEGGRGGCRKPSSSNGTSGDASADYPTDSAS